ncbi:hypothetical protein CONPUDRAFT_78184 [Coniophora puteana RWD-64-598 SS2]|uniref:Uncharacterized protein n=1 Tax=Coniophora puteana (strain RWD-64-598) TaxID=741705 RepID=R7SEF8_CONPW|nr:uncharacterized protein CONPUDRAFT_78184 [Coniophora puteana RWD-64-598 SS2]EIW74215.1 hypothetical protein CONPUDRAFT_78184 [Coniophora puteana RWD-64-598 SS2]
MSYNYQKFLENDRYSDDPENSQPPPSSQPRVSRFESDRRRERGLYQLDDIPTRSQAPRTHGTQAEWGEVQQLRQQVTDLASMVSSLVGSLQARPTPVPTPKPLITIKPDPDAPSEAATGPENGLPAPPSVPALIRGHDTVSGLQFDDDPDLELHPDDYSPCSYTWTISDWSLHVDAQTLATGMQGGRPKGVQGRSAQSKDINVCNTYLVNNLGEPISGRQAEAVRAKMKATWFTLLKHHRGALLPQTWGQMDSGTLTWFIAANRRVSPVLRLCGDNWKLLELGKHYYSGWRDQYAPWLKSGSGDNNKSARLSKQGNTKNAMPSSSKRVRSDDTAEDVPDTAIGSVPGPSKRARTDSSESAATSSTSLSHSSSTSASSFDASGSADDPLALSTPLADALAKYPSSDAPPLSVKGKGKAKAGKVHAGTPCVATSPPASIANIDSGTLPVNTGHISPSIPAPDLVPPPIEATIPTPTAISTPQPAPEDAISPTLVDVQPPSEQATSTPMACDAPQPASEIVEQSIPIAPEGNAPTSGRAQRNGKKNNISLTS